MLLLVASLAWVVRVDIKDPLQVTLAAAEDLTASAAQLVVWEDLQEDSVDLDKIFPMALLKACRLQLEFLKGKICTRWTD